MMDCLYGLYLFLFDIVLFQNMILNVYTCVRKRRELVLNSLKKLRVFSTHIRS